MTGRQLLLIRYGELGLKGKNKYKFINTLHNNMSRAVADLDETMVKNGWGRLWVETAQPQVAISRLQKVFGIYSLSPVLQVEKNIEDIAKAAYQTLITALPQGGSFKIETRRSDKTFPLTSPEISKEIASIIFSKLDDHYTADMHMPERVIWVEIRTKGAFVYGDLFQGAGGLPVGTGGKALLLLSGGIDSPVAGWHMLKRGVCLEAVHFHSFPFTGEQSKEKVITLCRLLSSWQGKSVKLHVVHFTEIQKSIHRECEEEYGITLMRRMMFRLAERLAKQRQALALVTGESVGQVASQTLESIATINNAVSIPVLRPLIGMDKADIIQIAQRIGSFETSILPYEDCCTIFLPPHPKIRPQISEAINQEQALDIKTLLAEALNKTETLNISI
ncbi:MAG: tRNA 4-thiouridine(8) synthase ThiI [Firmicutes bacterium]|nr:tRNA 4-thiouridine(8) synthase ThiI [Bacillota bacterium]